MPTHLVHTGAVCHKWAQPQNPCASPCSAPVGKNQGPRNRPLTLNANGEGQASRLRLRKESGAAISPGGRPVAFHHCCPTGTSLPGCGPTPSLRLTSAGTTSLTPLLFLTAPSGTQPISGHLLCRAERARHRAASWTPCRETPTEPGMSGGLRGSDLPSSGR